jgi:hypothetical protein
MFQSVYSLVFGKDEREPIQVVLKVPEQYKQNLESLEGLPSK